jgi:hypothetical protein
MVARDLASRWWCTLPDRGRALQGDDDRAASRSGRDCLFCGACREHREYVDRY